MIRTNRVILSAIVATCLVNSLIMTGSTYADPDIITEINSNINAAFESILQAEREGADIQKLIEDINSITLLFQQSKIEFSEERLTEAELHAQECITLSRDLTIEAQSLSTSAAEETQLQGQMNFYSRSLLVAIIITSSLIIWLRFKRYYMDRILDMKPVVVDNES